MTEALTIENPVLNKYLYEKGTTGKYVEVKAFSLDEAFKILKSTLTPKQAEKARYFYKFRTANVMEKQKHAFTEKEYSENVKQIN